MPRAKQEGSAHAQKPVEGRRTSAIDWYLLGIIAQLMCFAAIGVVDFASARLADVVFQCINLTVALGRLLLPQHEPRFGPFCQHLRSATRILRPTAHVGTALAYYNRGNALVSAYYAGNAVYDIALVAIGAATLFNVKRIDLFKAFFREVWVVFCCLRFAKSLGDPYAMASSLAELAVTNGFIYVYVLGRDPVPMRIIGGLGIFVATQKLLYLLTLSV